MYENECSDAALQPNEVSICQARASVMLYDEVTKKWVPAGSSSGLSKVQIYHHTANSTFRIVGRKINDHEVVINCAIQKSLKYNQATQTFHQWRDNRQVYGLNFSSKDDADAFAQAMVNQALEILNNGSAGARQIPPPPPPHQTPPGMVPPQQQQQPPQPPPHQQAPQYMPQQPPHYQPHPQQYEDDHAYRSIGRDDPPMGPGGPGMPLRMAPQPPPPPPSNHHRNNSAPPAPPAPPPAPPAPPHAPPAPHTPMGGAAPVPPPPPPPAGGGPPPPPPPPSHNLTAAAAAQDESPSGGLSGLAGALAGAKLRKVKPPDSDSTGSSSSSGGSSGGGSIGRGPGDRPPLMGMSMMDEMAATLARRKQKTAAATVGTNGDSTVSSSGGGTLKGLGQKSPSSSKLSTNGTSSTASTNNSNSNRSSGGESPKPVRKRFGSTCDDAGSARMNGINSSDGSVSQHDLDSLREELMAHITKEVNKCKQDIIEAIKMELNRR